MAREILFKAKRIDNGEWVEGSIITRKDTKRVFMVDIDNITALRSVTTNYCDRYDWRAVEVKADTICQFTGLLDKTGNKIWENDVVKRQDLVFTSLRKKELRTKIGYVDFSCDGYGNGYWVYWWDEKSGRCNFGINRDCCEVIGNIFDNPELLGGGE